jgi:hypothetical protein
MPLPSHPPGSEDYVHLWIPTYTDRHMVRLADVLCSLDKVWPFIQDVSLVRLLLFLLCRASQTRTSMCHRSHFLFSQLPRPRINRTILEMSSLKRTPTRNSARRFEISHLRTESSWGPGVAWKRAIKQLLHR